MDKKSFEIFNPSTEAIPILFGKYQRFAFVSPVYDVKHGVYISHKHCSPQDRKHMFVIIFFELPRYGLVSISL